MNDIQSVLMLIKGFDITCDQTVIIDETLSTAKCEDIPNDHLQEVANYIDLELAHNLVSEEVKVKLEHLYNELQLRIRAS